MCFHHHVCTCVWYVALHLRLHHERIAYFEHLSSDLAGVAASTSHATSHTSPTSHRAAQTSTASHVASHASPSITEMLPADVKQEAAALLTSPSSQAPPALHSPYAHAHLVMTAHAPSHTSTSHTHLTLPDAHIHARMMGSPNMGSPVAVTSPRPVQERAMRAVQA